MLYRTVRLRELLSHLESRIFANFYSLDLMAISSRIPDMLLTIVLLQLLQKCVFCAFLSFSKILIFRKPLMLYFIILLQCLLFIHIFTAVSHVIHNLKFLNSQLFEFMALFNTYCTACFSYLIKFIR